MYGGSAGSGGWPGRFIRLVAGQFGAALSCTTPALPVVVRCAGCPAPVLAASVAALWM